MSIRSRTIGSRAERSRATNQRAKPAAIAKSSTVSGHGRRESGSSASATVNTARAPASSAAPGQSTRPRTRSRPASHHAPARKGTASGRLSQNTQRQPSASVMTPPQSGPISAPPSEAAAIAPSPISRRAGGSSSTTIAIATGTTAPPPTAWRARAATSHSKPGAAATSALPTTKISSAAEYTRACP